MARLYGVVFSDKRDEETVELTEDNVELKR